MNTPIRSFATAAQDKGKPQAMIDGAAREAMGTDQYSLLRQTLPANRPLDQTPRSATRTSLALDVEGLIEFNFMKRKESTFGPSLGPVIQTSIRHSYEAGSGVNYVRTRHRLIGCILESRRRRRNHSSTNIVARCAERARSGNSIPRQGSGTPHRQ